MSNKIKRNKGIRIRLSEEELERLKRTASSRGLSCSELIRLLVKNEEQWLAFVSKITSQEEKENK